MSEAPTLTLPTTLHGALARSPTTVDDVIRPDFRPGDHAVVDQLRILRDSHPFWDTPLLKACDDGALSKDDLAYVFAQYSLYSRGFTRYLAALMARCDNDLLRARLSQNLWEEGGGAEPHRRHAEIFRAFLRQGLQLDLGTIVFDDAARNFAREYMDYCLHGDPVSVAAFLSLGTEGIVPRMYGRFLHGLRAAGVAEEHLEFFRIHIAADDEHAATLEEIMLSDAWQPGWREACRAGMEKALELRMHFFERLYAGIAERRVAPMMARITARKSLQDAAPVRAWRCGVDGEGIYENEIEKHGIRFSVQRLPVNAEVLDPRVVRIPAGKRNEHHRHAHETVFLIVSGAGEVTVGDSTVPVTTGDAVFVPRWAMHQSHNTGEQDLVILAVTDFGLTGKAYVGDYEKTARLKRAARPNSP